MRFTRTVTYVIEAPTIERAEVCWDDGGPKLDSSSNIRVEAASAIERAEMCMEDCVPEFARLLTACAEEHGAPVFADDLARGGMDPASLRMMAERWRDGNFAPDYFADDLYRLADDCEALVGQTP